MSVDPVRDSSISYRSKKVKGERRLCGFDYLKKHMSQISNGVDILLKPNIIYEDENFLVIEKPAGLLIHPVRVSKKKLKLLSSLKKIDFAKKNEHPGYSNGVNPTVYQKENTLVDWLKKYYPKIKDVGEKNRPGIVHRLDKDVSGLLIIAKNQVSYNFFIKQFKKRQIKKEYVALVYGKFSQNKGVIDFPIARTKNGKIIAVKYRKKIKLEKEAITKYEIIKRFFFKDKNYTFLKIQLLTGRTHQIRVHLKAIGHPIVGDKKYSIRQFSNLISQSLSKGERLFLHANYLGFYDMNGQWREFKSKLPKKIENFLNGLK